MATIPTEDIPKIATTLIKLRGETLASISKATGIRTANLSVWLRGREQVISQRRVVELMHHLGIKGSELRTDIIHQWSTRGNIDDLKQILSATLNQTQKENFLIIEDDSIGLSINRLLQFENNEKFGWILVKLEPSIDGSPDLNPSTLGFGKIVETSFDLKSLPTSISEFKLAIASIYEDITKQITANDISLIRSVEDMLHELTSKLPNARDYRYGLDANMMALQAELIRILKTGISPQELTSKLMSIY